MSYQQEKEALDDLGMELELTDEDQTVMCVILLAYCYRQADIALGIEWVKLLYTCGMAKPSSGSNRTRIVSTHSSRV